MPAGLTCTCFLEPTSRPDDVREHACQSSQNHPGLVLKSLHTEDFWGISSSARRSELKANNITLKDSFDDTEKKLDRVMLSLIRSESQVKIFATDLGIAAKFRDPELAFSEVSGRTFSGIVNFVDPLSFDVC